MNAHHRSLRAPRDEPIECDAGGVRADLRAVDALAYAALTARSLGCAIVVRHASGELQALIDLVGLSPVLRCAPASTVEPWRQAEEREDPFRVEEERDAADPTA